MQEQPTPKKFDLGYLKAYLGVEELEILDRANQQYPLPPISQAVLDKLAYTEVLASSAGKYSKRLLLTSSPGKSTPLDWLEASPGFFFTEIPVDAVWIGFLEWQNPPSDDPAQMSVRVRNFIQQTSKDQVDPDLDALGLTVADCLAYSVAENRIILII